MALVDDLKECSNKKFEELIAKFVETIIPLLKESAEIGYQGWKTKAHDLDGDEAILFRNPKFIRELEKLLEGMKVSFRDEEYGSTLFPQLKFTKKFLVIRWDCKEGIEWNN